MDVIELIQYRNSCLRKLLAISDTYLASEVSEDATEALQHFDQFQIQRDACCRALELIDRKITATAQLLSNQSQLPPPASVQKIKAHSDTGDNLIRLILQKDESVFLRVDEIKIKMQGEISGSIKGQKSVGRFKSQWVQTPGGSLDGTA